MGKLVVSTWSRNTAAQQFGRTYANRGEWLKEALKSTMAKVSTANYPSAPGSSS